MNIKEQHIVAGMATDMSVSRFEPTKVSYARNIRITQMEGNQGLLCVTNEKGTRTCTLSSSITGKIIGDAVLNERLVLFTHLDGDNVSNPDHIYLLEEDENTDFQVSQLFEGNLNFDTAYPLETVSVYESEKIQKVYWVDGRNQLRCINVEDPQTGNTSTTYNGYNALFDACPAMNLTHKVSVEKLNSGGEFPAGTIQYAFTYFNINGPETNVFGVTPLYELCPQTKGLAADGRAVCSFKLSLMLLEPNFDYVRVYAITRTSANGAPSVRIVGDYSITVTGGASGRTITVVDNGMIGESVDSSYLLFAGGEPVCPSTITVKDNTLFLGNIKLKRPSLAGITYEDTTVGAAIEQMRSDGKLPLTNPGSANTTAGSGDWFYDYKINNNRASTSLRRFKRGETYRLGVIAQYETGMWSDVLWLGDYENTVTPEFYEHQQKAGYFKLAKKLSGQDDTDISGIFEAIQNAGFKNIAPVVVYPEGPDRTVFCQGLVSATVYNVEDRYNNKPFSQASWFFRPIAEGFGIAAIPHASLYPVMLNTYSAPTIDNSNTRPTNIDSFNDMILGTAEVQINTNPRNYLPRVKGYFGQTSQDPSLVELDDTEMVSLFGNDYYVDTSIVTLNSPDIELDDSLQQEDFTGLKFRIVGIAKSGYQNMVTDSYIDVTAGKYPEEKVLPNSLSRLLYYRQRPFTYCRANIPSYPGYAGMSEYTGAAGSVRALMPYIIYPWHKTGRIVGDSNNSDDKDFGVLNHKIYSNFWFAHTHLFTSNSLTGIPTDPIKLFDDTQNSFIPLEETADGKVYYGNVDTVRLYKKDVLGTHSGNQDQNLGQNFNMQEPAIKMDEVNPCKFNEKVRTPVNSDKYSVITGMGFEGYIDGVEDTAHRLDIESALLKYGGRRNSHEDDVFLDNTPVPIRYKSTKHAVIALAHDDDEVPSLYKCEALSELDSSYDEETESNLIKPFWGNGNTYRFTLGKAPFATEISDVNYNTAWSADDKTGYKVWHSDIPTLYIGELYRDFSQAEMNARFGGNSIEALQKNVWMRCGETLDLTSFIGLNKTLDFREGDTYLARYDCLKTYPYAEDDINSIVEIFSTDLETRVNLDARYDNARGLMDNTLVRPENINLVNRLGFEQENNFFTYNVIDPNRDAGDQFPNLLAISREKTFGEEIDSWCSIDLLSTQDLEGTYGEIQALRTFNNDVFAFQTNAFGQVLFNSRVQIPTSDGQPIEITNGMKLQGIRYLSNKIGCSNKWSIAISNSRMYWYDAGTKDIWAFGSQIENLSTSLGVKGWLKDVSPNAWSVADKSPMRTLHDEKYNDLYFIVSNPSKGNPIDTGYDPEHFGALVYSETMNTFVSVMDYAGLVSMHSLNDKVLAIKEDSLNAMWEGSYNSFFGTNKPYILRFIANAQPNMHKVFDTVQWRSDTWNAEGKYLPLETFKKLSVWNQYQKSDEISLTGKKYKPSPLKKKFNTFRALVPRDRQGNSLTVSPEQDVDTRYKGFSRIRGNYAVIELKHDENNTNKMQFYDLEIGEFL